MKNQLLVGWGTAQSDAYVGPPREITVDTDRRELRLHDGVKPGGHRFLNESQIQAYGSLEFTAVMTLGLQADHQLDGTAVRKLIQVSAIGGIRNVVLPPLAEFDVGESILIRATGNGVQIKPAVNEGWIHQVNEEVNFVYAIPNGSTIKLAKLSPTRFIVLNMY